MNTGGIKKKEKELKLGVGVRSNRDYQKD